jgi:hypothetical protein
MGSGLPQFGFPRRFAIDLVSLEGVICLYFLGDEQGGSVSPKETLQSYFTDIFFKNQ